MLVITVLIAAGTSWYTINLARVAWRDGNRWGAAVVGVLAAVAFALPILATYLN
jgi:hypothetical protein